MRICSILILSTCCGATLSFADAPEVASNSNALVAKFIDKKGVHGTISFSAQGMTPVRISVALKGLPVKKGPFAYYIGDIQVPADHSCERIDGPLDPYGRGGNPTCNAEDPGSCQVGDLSGKHGSLQGPQDQESYIDPYLSLTPGNPAYLGRHSVVIDSSDGSRVACANIELKQVGGDASHTAHGDVPKETCSQIPCVRGIPDVTQGIDQGSGDGSKTKYVPKTQPHDNLHTHLLHSSVAHTKQTQCHKHRHSATQCSKPHHSRTRHAMTKTTKHKPKHTRTATHSAHRTTLSLPLTKTLTGPGQLPVEPTAQVSATPSFRPFSEGSSLKDVVSWNMKGYGIHVAISLFALLAGLVWVL